MSTDAEQLQDCQWCGGLHGKLCPYVKALEFDVAGNVTRVEFVTAADMKQSLKPAQEESQEYPRLGSKDAA